MVSELFNFESGPLFATGQTFQQAVNKKYCCIHSLGRMELGQPWNSALLPKASPKLDHTAVFQPR